MNLGTYSSHKKDDGSISFPPLQCWNPITQVATIAAQVSGRRVSCRIGIEDLTQRFATTHAGPMQAITKHRAAIEQAARTLIESNRFEPDGSITIRSRDI